MSDVGGKGLDEREAGGVGGGEIRWNQGVWRIVLIFFNQGAQNI